MMPDQTNSKLYLPTWKYGQPLASLLDLQLWEYWSLNDLIVGVKGTVKRAAFNLKKMAQIHSFTVLKINDAQTGQIQNHIYLKI